MCERHLSGLPAPRGASQTKARSGWPLSRGAVHELLLPTVGLVAIVWAIIRACVQSLTLDEADTYFWFVAKGEIWHPFPNNHILNTLLIWIATHLLGTSILTVRTPALVGGVLYIFVCYFLCRHITDRLGLQLSLFVCLIFNPFIFDFMVAARGYGLADAFLLAAIAAPVWYTVSAHASLSKCCIFASFALGLSFAANFSFAFVDLAAFAATAAWAIRMRGETSIVRIITSCALPALFVALALCGYPLTHWPKGELWYGAHSLREMTQSLIEASFYQPPRFLDADLSDIMDLLRLMLPPTLALLCASQLLVTALDGSWRRDDGRLRRFGAALVGITATSVVMSWLAFRFGKLPLPLSRTGIFLIPLCTLVAGVADAMPARSWVARWLRQGITGALICLACYYLLCLRISYFREYADEADIKDVYSVLARLNSTYRVTDVVSSGLYVNSLNFYRVLSKRETFPEFSYLPADALPTGKSIYVLPQSYYHEFIAKEKLAIVYRGRSTEVVVAVRPDGPIPPTLVEP